MYWYGILLVSYYEILVWIIDNIYQKFIGQNLYLYIKSLEHSALICIYNGCEKKWIVSVMSF